TRWNYVYNVLARLSRVKISIEKVLKAHKKHVYLLSDDDWNLLDNTVEFLKLFSDCTNMSSKEKEAVSSEVIVTIISMYNHLDSYENHDYLGSVAKEIKTNMKTKFSHFFYDKPGAKEFEGTYLVATLLDPRYRLILPTSQRLLAREFLLKEYNLVAPSPPPNDSERLQRFNERPHTSQAKFPFLQQMKEAFVREMDDSIPGGNKFQAELDRYINCTEYDSLLESDDVFKFWSNKQDEYPLLSPLALDYISIP
ncbi:unnamed protein product, partial [Allacma fusca]